MAPIKKSSKARQLDATCARAVLLSDIPAAVASATLVTAAPFFKQDAVINSIFTGYSDHCHCD